jgi:hypothetical protein
MKVPVTLVIHTEIELDDETPDVRWRVEESYCVQNVIEQLHADMDDDCSECGHSVLLYGRVDLEQVKRSPRK